MRELKQEELMNVSGGQKQEEPLVQNVIQVIGTRGSGKKREVTVRFTSDLFAFGAFPSVPLIDFGGEGSPISTLIQSGTEVRGIDRDGNNIPDFIDDLIANDQIFVQPEGMTLEPDFVPEAAVFPE